MRLIEDFHDIPTLEFLISIRFVIAIWNRRDIVRSITQTLDGSEAIEFSKSWREVNNEVLVVIRHMDKFPTMLKEDLKEIVKPIGHEIKAMRTFANFSPYHESKFSQFPVNYWTPYGTVDTKRLNKILAQDNKRDIGFRFHLACNDCFEELIMELYPLLSDIQKLKYQQIEINKELISYWSYRISENLPEFVHLTLPVEDEEPTIYSAQEIAFKYTMINGSRSGIEYFLDRLEPDRTKPVILGNIETLIDPLGYREDIADFPIRCYEQYADALYFLLSRFDERELSILSEFYYQILMKFLVYPFFGLFRKYGNIWVKTLGPHTILSILSRIQHLMDVDTHFFGYELHRDFWNSIPKVTKEFIIHGLGEEQSITVSELLADLNLG